MEKILINTCLAFFLACQAGVCQGASTNSASSWSTSVTTRTYSSSTTRTISHPAATKGRSIPGPFCPIKPAGTGAKSVCKKIGNGANDHNCVLYLRQQRGIKLPQQNLTTYAAKLSIINSSVPQERSVAIIQTPGKNAGIGHLAEVTALDQADGKVTMRLSEANNPNRGYYQRTITGINLKEIQKNANIVGYYLEPDET